jgi:ubiquinone/menaquinone biosynthesis C-methylase UbiE
MNPINMYQSFFDNSAFSRNFVTKYYYQIVSRFLGNAEVSFMDYGYANLGESPQTIMLDETDEPNRMPIQMYHHLASSINLEGKDVLEVSCGRGGGASFVNRYHHPRSLVGIDRTQRAIAYCRRKHRQHRLTFLQGDAEAIDFGSECFDVVLNVEASHLYGHVDIFLGEVNRVLRQGGYLLIADKRTSAELQLLHRQILNSGLEVICEHDISANVLQSIRLQRAKRIQMIQNLLPRNLTWLAIHMVGVDGSHLANALATGDTHYLSFILRKI